VLSVCAAYPRVPCGPLQACLVRSLRGSGLFLILVDGALLLLGTDPAGYPLALGQQQQLWDNLTSALLAADLLVAPLGSRSVATRMPVTAFCIGCAVPTHT
jgi:hypothetical protein